MQLEKMNFAMKMSHGRLSSPATTILTLGVCFETFARDLKTFYCFMIKSSKKNHYSSREISWFCSICMFLLILVILLSMQYFV